MSTITLEDLKKAARLLEGNRAKPVVIDGVDYFWFLISEETRDMIIEDLRSKDGVLNTDLSLT